MSGVDLEGLRERLTDVRDFMLTCYEGEWTGPGETEQVADDINAAIGASEPLRWQSEPAEEGWYWMRNPGVPDDRDLAHLVRHWDTAWDYRYPPDSSPFRVDDWEYAGPIPEAAK